MNKLIGIIAFYFLFFASPKVAGQTVLSMDEVVRLALERNPATKAAALRIRQQESLKGTVIDLPPTEISLLYGQYNSIHRNDNNVSISQTIPFPSLFTAGNQLVKSRVLQARNEAVLIEAELKSRVRRKVNELLFLKENRKLLLAQDSIFRELLRVAEVRHRTGEGTRIDVTAAKSQLMQTSNALHRNSLDNAVSLRQLAILCLSDDVLDVSGTLQNLFSVKMSDTVGIAANPEVRLQGQRVEVARAERKFQLAVALPSFKAGFFTQTLIGNQTVDGVEQYFGHGDRFHGVQVGLSIPLFFNAANARVRASRYAAEAAESTYADMSLNIQQEYLAVRENVRKNFMSLNFYEDTALQHADLLVNQARRSFQEGETGYGMLLINLRQAIDIREEYIKTLYALNDNLISLLLLTDN